MKSFVSSSPLFLFLLLLITFSSFDPVFSRNFNASSKANGTHHYQRSYNNNQALTGDDNADAELKGSGVELEKAGPVELIIPSQELIIEIGEVCEGTYHICYDAFTEDSEEAEKLCPGRNGQCGFKFVNDPEDDENLYINQQSILKKPFGDTMPHSIKMIEKYAKPDGLTYLYSCRPKFSEDNHLKVYVEQANCHFKIIDAEIWTPPTTTVATTTTEESTTETSAEAGIPWYAWVLIAILIIITLIALAVGLYCILKATKTIPGRSAGGSVHTANVSFNQTPAEAAAENLPPPPSSSKSKEAKKSREEKKRVSSAQ